MVTDISRKPTDDEIRKFLDYHQKKGLFVPDPEVYPIAFIHQFRRYRLMNMKKVNIPTKKKDK